VETALFTKVTGAREDPPRGSEPAAAAAPASALA